MRMHKNHDPEVVACACGWYRGCPDSDILEADEDEEEEDE